MSITSFAQNLEDVILWRALGDIPVGTYIDVGAQDPVSDSVSFIFYEAGWRGISVEATPPYVEALRTARTKEMVIQAAVTDTPGPISFYQINGTGLSTGVKEIADRHAEAGWTVATTTVPSIRLEFLFELVAGEVHWLKIDVEGMEGEVLRSWGDHPARPWIIVVEATAPLSQDFTDYKWRAEVERRGYSETLFDGLSRYFVHEDHADLRARLSTGANVFDDYRVTARHFSVQDLAREFHEKLTEGARLREHLDESLAEAGRGCRSLEDSLSEAEARSAAQTSRLLAMEAERREIVESLTRIYAELGEVTRTVDELQRARAEAELALEGARAALDEHARALAEAREEQARSQRALAEAAMRLEVRSHILAKVRGARDQAEQALAAVRAELGERTRSLDDVRQMREEAEQSLAQAERSLTQAGVELEKQTRLAELAASRCDRLEAAAAATQQELDAMQRVAQDAIAHPRGLWHRLGQRLGLAREDPARQALRTWCLNRANFHDEIWKATMHSFSAGDGPDPYHRANSLNELLAWHDVDFVRCAYVTVLGRQPDQEGEAHYTGLVRSGRSRMEILWRLRRSPEGMMHDPGIAGFDRALKRERWSRNRLVGLFRNRFGGTEADGTVNRQIRALENDVGQILRLERNCVSLLSKLVDAPDQLDPSGAPPDVVQALAAPGSVDGDASQDMPDGEVHLSPRARAISSYLAGKKQAAQPCIF